MGRQPTLDGIRGLAILAVLAFHQQLHWLPGGFLGVDIFFALSGFLITTLLLEEDFQRGGISLPGFFFRRVVRLYPALICLVIVSTAFTLLKHQASVGRAAFVAAGVLGYCANWITMVDPKGWFGGMPHTWSLSVEAHFYLLWALTVTYVVRRHPNPADRRKLLNLLTTIALVIVVASATWRACLWWRQQVGETDLDALANAWLRTYLATDCRLDGVFLGATAALIRLRIYLPGGTSWFASLSRPAVITLQSVALAGLAFLLATTRWGTALPGLVGFGVASGLTGILILTTVMHTGTFAGALFGNSILMWIGRISYSIYIWHVPADKFLDKLLSHGWNPALAETLRTVVTIILGALSYYIVERTCLKLKNPFRPALPTEKAVQAARG